MNSIMFIIAVVMCVVGSGWAWFNKPAKIDQSLLPKKEKPVVVARMIWNPGKNWWTLLHEGRAYRYTPKDDQLFTMRGEPLGTWTDYQVRLEVGP